MAKIRILCPTCDGSAIEIDSGHVIECRDCDGRGRIWVESASRPSGRGLWAIIAIVLGLTLIALALLAASSGAHQALMVGRSDGLRGAPPPGQVGLSVGFTSGVVSGPTVRPLAHGGGAPQPDAAIGKPLVGLPETDTDLAGTATWYCGSGSRCTRGHPAGQLVAAAGSELRFPGWRGSWVRVFAGGRHVDVQLVDWCACRGSRVIDLYAAAFARLAPTSRGEIFVTVQQLGPRPPATDMKEPQ